MGPVKLPLVKHHQYAILNNASFGPTFGGGHDLHVANGSTGSYTNLGHAYQLPPGQSALAKTFFTGGCHFQAAEVEVHQVQLH